MECQPAILYNSLFILDRRDLYRAISRAKEDAGVAQ